jgi:hypothetical protein
MGLDMYLRRKTTETIHSWRKANAIHGWIINNAGVEDDCKPIHLEMSDIVALRDDIQKVLDEGTEEVIMELLPPTPGFFFGGTEVDEYYWMNLKSTLTLLNEIIENSTEDQEFEYQASW